MNFTRYKFALWRLTTLLSVGILTLAMIASISGVLIGFNYQPTSLGAHNSLEKIATQLSSGNLLLSLHHWAGEIIVIAGLIQILVMFFGREAKRSWFLGWVSGFAVTAISMALGWTAMILSWDQLGFWRLKVEVSTLGSLPIIGSLINLVLLDNGSIDSVALTHFYAIHSYILPGLAIALAIVHLVSLYRHEQQEKKLIIQQLDRLAEPQKSLESQPEDLVGSSST